MPTHLTAALKTCLPHWISHLYAHLKQELEEMLHVPVDLVSLRDPLKPNLS